MDTKYAYHCETRDRDGNGGTMKTADSLHDDMPDEIDFSGAERGRYAGRIAPDATVILLDSDVMEVFPDSEAVNAELRMVMRAGMLAAGKESGKERQAS